MGLGVTLVVLLIMGLTGTVAQQSEEIDILEKENDKLKIELTQ